MEDPGAALAVLLFRPELRHVLIPPERPPRPTGPGLLDRCLDAARRLRAIRVTVRVELPREPSSRMETFS
jgi:hypothetical protein